MDLLNPRSVLNPEAWGIQTNLEEEGQQGDRPPVIIQKGARVRQSILGADTIIEGRVEESVLFPGVRVGKGARVINSIIMHDCQIGANAYLERVIMDKKGRVGEKARVDGRAALPNREFSGHLKEGLTLVGKGASIPPKIRIRGNTIIRPWVTEADYKGPVVGQGETVRKK
jgi:glucose-1-phosphate adenylyltransferase